MSASADAASPVERDGVRPPLRYADVVVETPTGKHGDTFTYSVPDHMDLAPGHLVRVPFATRRLRGVVVGLRDTANVDYTKPIGSLVEDEPLLTPARIELARWVADYYMASPFDALAPMLPPGLRSRSRTYVQLKDAPEQQDEDRLSRGARRLLMYLRAHPGPHQVSKLSGTLGTWTPNAVRALVEAGVVQETRSDRTPQRPAVRRVQALIPAQRPAALRAYAADHPRATRQGGLLNELARTPKGIGATDARKRYGHAVVAAVIAAGLASLQEVSPQSVHPPQPPLLPTDDQQRALGAIRESLDDAASAHRVWLLHGVTGSGKTEVYLQSIAHCLTQGRRAMVLVPELALTPQALERFDSRFPGRVCVLHSGLTPARQRNEWWRIFHGERDIVIGSRSAVFAPVENLGLIIVDEEHEWTYKQVDASPWYHARDVAERLASLVGAVVVLGSATPDVATSYRAERGEIGKIALPNRVERSGAVGEMASVVIVDMRQELREGNRSIFSRLLTERLRETVAADRQAVLFLNRRGAASVVECRNCGLVMRCPRCSLPLTYHQRGNTGGELLCHHCGRHRGVPARCPRCKSDRIRYLGIGTQRVAEEVAAVVPDARVLRWDSDTTPTAGAHERLLEEFTSGGASVLIGTQMVAKGLDIPSVDLVGVVLADIGLHMPDFRAAERTFQLLTQVAGRAGRGDQPGHVVVQTYLPEHYAVQAAADQNYDRFYAEEMEYRRAQSNPPLSKLARLLYRNSDPKAGAVEATRFADVLRRVVSEWDMTNVDIIGPAPSYPHRVRNAWRWQIIVRAPEPRALLDKVDVPPAWHVDIDPVSMV